MIKIISNIWYWFCMGGTSFSEKCNPELDKYLKICNRNEITLLKKDMDNHHSIVFFENNLTYKFWDSNKYYAWLCYGTFHEGGKCIYDYRNQRPSLKQMLKFRRKLEKYRKEHNIS